MSQTPLFVLALCACTPSCAEHGAGSPVMITNIVVPNEEGICEPAGPYSSGASICTNGADTPSAVGVCLLFQNFAETPPGVDTSQRLFIVEGLNYEVGDEGPVFAPGASSVFPNGSQSVVSFLLRGVFQGDGETMVNVEGTGTMAGARTKTEMFSFPVRGFPTRCCNQDEMDFYPCCAQCPSSP